MSTTAAPEGELTPDAELREVLHRSALPIATFDLDEMCFVDANAAARAILNLADEAEFPHHVTEVVVDIDEDQAALAIRLLADDTILSYEAHRHLRRADGTMLYVHTWVRSLHVLHAHAALIVFMREDADNPASAVGQLPAASLRLSGPVVVGSLDLDMRVRRLSAEVEDLLGDPPDVLLNTPLVERLHRDDVAAFLLGLGRAVAEDQGSAMHVRFRHANGEYVGVRFVVTPTSGDPGTRLGIVMTEESSESQPDARLGELERHLWRIALEVQAAGVVDGLQRIPDASQVPGLEDLSTRQWDIVTRLLKGERVPDIARAMFVSQSTVRNQLGTIYRKVGVHSQSELLALLRGAQGQSV